ncbi:MAG: lytic murein transglycosylase [bacterium]|nr:lytic murein transglycosylase [bacterium]
MSFSFYHKTTIFILTAMVVFSLSGLIGLAQTPEEEKKALEEELKTLEEKIAQYEQDIGEVQKEKKTLQNQIKLLQSKIKTLDLQIRQGNLMIKDLGIQIDKTENEIETTKNKINETRGTLKQALRTFSQESRKGDLEILLESSQLSDFFSHLANLEALNLKISQSLTNVKSLKDYLENEKDNLDKEKDDLRRVVGSQVLKKQASQDSQKQQEVILKQTKGKETLYQTYLEETKKKAAEIRSRIFELIGVPKAPTFGQAYEIAKTVFKATGVRPAFLLAVITQESSLGRNVGQCNCPAGLSCKHPEIGWKEVMKENRDWQPFLEITKELGRDPNTTPVSCPMYLNGKRVGYGGAMGPAQFLPSTWMIYKAKVEEISGKKPADPWNISDAFLGAALYLKDYGATSKKADGEWRAAMIYFAGSVNTKYRFYGDSVINIAKSLEEDIKAIEKVQ